MTPYVNCICSVDYRPGPARRAHIFCYNTPSAFRSSLERLAPAYKLRFALDQAIAVSYFMWLYGSEADAFMTAYAEWLKDFIFNHLSKFEHDEFGDAVTSKLYKAAKNIASCWYGYDWIDVPASDIISYVYKTNSGYDAVAPSALYPEIAAPYLMFRNSFINSEDFPGEVRVPRYSLSDGYISVGGIKLGVGYSRDYPVETTNSALFSRLVQSIKEVRAPILQLMLHVNCTFKTFEGLLDFLGYMRMSPDPTTVCCGNSKLFYATYTILHDIFSVDFLDVVKDNGVLRAKERASYEGIGAVLLDLLVYFNERYGVVAKSKELFYRFFNSKLLKNHESIQRAVRFVSTAGTDMCKAEDAEAVESLGLSCEAMKLIISDSQNTTIPAEVSGIDETEEENEDGQGENFDLSKLPELDVAEPGLEAEEDGDTMTDGDQPEGTDDSSSGDGNKEEGGDNKQDDANSGDDLEGTGDPGGDPGTDPNNSNVQGPSTPEEIDASDDEGIVFEIAPEGSETVDSVLAREELDKFISDILVNPPKSLSPQTVSALTTLQRNWVHILSVETIVGILAKLVKLPEKFANIKITHGDNS